MAASPGTVTVAQLEGLYKTVYADGIADLIPDQAKLTKQIGALEESERVGKAFNEPVILQNEQGYTYGGSDGTAFDILTPVPMLMDEASLEGSEGVLTSRISYRAAAKAVAGGPKAFKKAMNVVLESHLKTHATRREFEAWYGRSPTGLGTFSASTTVDTTHETLTISAATWAVGIWAGNEGAKVQIFQSSDGALVSSGDDSVFVVESVDPDNRKITVKGTTTGCTALASVEAGHIDFYGARATLTTTHKCFEGVDYVLTLAAGNTLWGISTNYTLWRGNTSAVGGQFTIGKVLSGINKAVAKGGLDETVDLWVSAATWANLSDSINATRMTDSSYSTGEGKQGVEKIIYHGANGAINVKIHNVIKEGESFALPTKKPFRKVGSTDITTQTPGKGSEMFIPLAANAGFDFRSYSDYALFTDKLAKMVKFTGIVNS